MELGYTKKLYLKIEKFKENNLPKVSFLKLLTKENPLECFH